MKHAIRFITLAVVLMIQAANVWGENITIIQKVNGIVDESAGTVRWSINQSNALCTLSITSNYTVESVTAQKTIGGNYAQGRSNLPMYGGAITVTQASADTWTFQWPGDNYGVEVTVNYNAYTADIAHAQVTLTPSYFTYEDYEQKPSVSVELNQEVLREWTDYTISWPDDEYTSIGYHNLIINGIGNYYGTQAVAYSIDYADPYVYPPTPNELYYNGKPQELVSAGDADGGQMYYSLQPYNFQKKIPTATEIGTYTVYYVVYGDENHYDSSVSSVTVTINKGRVKVTPPTANELTYTGEPQELVTAGSAEGGTIEYNLDGGDFSNAIPKATEIGTYTVGYRILSDEKYEEAEGGSVEVTINKRQLKVTPPTARELTYTGEPQELVNAGSVDGGTMEYSTDGTTYDEAIPTGTDAGTYTVWYKIKSDAYYEETEGGSVEVTIGKAKAKITKRPEAIEDLKATEDEQPLELITPGEAEGGKMVYCLKDDNYSEAIPTAAKEGTYIIYYKVAGDNNHDDTEAESLSVTIAPAYQKYDIWVGGIQVTEKNAKDILGDGTQQKDASMQYFVGSNTLFLINCTAGDITTKQGLTLYLFPLSENSTGQVTYIGDGSEALSITTDGNFPGKVTLTGNPVISGFSELTLGQNLAIMDPENAEYDNGALAAESATIGIAMEPIVNGQVEWLNDIDESKTDLTNGMTEDNRMLLTLKNVDSENGDGLTEDGAVALNTPMNDSEASQVNINENAPGTKAFAEKFTGITILVAPGKGEIIIDAETSGDYVMKMINLNTGQILQRMHDTERKQFIYEYEFDEPTYVGIYNGGEEANSARSIVPAKKKVGSVKVYAIVIKNSEVKASNPAQAASSENGHGSPNGYQPAGDGNQVPDIGQDPEKPTPVVPNSIETIKKAVKKTDDRWYDLNGRVVTEPRKKGLYIYNGQKTYVR